MIGIFRIYFLVILFIVVIFLMFQAQSLHDMRLYVEKLISIGTYIKGSKSVNQNYLCDIPTFDENEEIALNYLKNSFKDLRDTFNECDPYSTSLSENKIVDVSFLGTLNGKENFKIKVNKNEVINRGKFENENSTCYIQRFEKKVNNSEGGYCSWCNELVYDEPQEMQFDLELFVSKTGFYYLKCSQTLENKTHYFDEVFMVLPQNMSNINEKRLEYKKYSDLFKSTLNYSKTDPFLYDVDYSKDCFNRSDSESIQLNNPKFNVLIIGIDSISFNHFKRILPITFKYLNNDLEDNIVFSHLNSVDESTLYNLLPMLAGIRKNESTDIYDYFDRYWYDTIPFIWDSYEKDGYISYYNEEFPDLGTFQYTRYGFRYYPTSLYSRAFWVKFYKIRTHPSPTRCHYARPSFLKFFDTIEHFLENMNHDVNSNTPYFAFNWLTEYTHNHMALPLNFDILLTEFLKKLESKGYFDKTLLLFLTDHGNKLIDFAKTESGRHERLLPFLSVKLPKSLIGTSLHTNVINNKDKIISFFDIYQSLRHFLFVNKYGLESLQNESDSFCKNQFRNNSFELRNLRGISIFEEIPLQRSCSDAQIPKTYCSCFHKENLDEKQFLSETKITFNSAALIALNEIRNLTFEVKSLCAPYSLAKTNSFKRIVFNDGEIIYSGRMELQPGEALFEINFKMNSSGLILNDTPLRLSRYDNQSYCVSKRLLKNLCFCS